MRLIDADAITDFMIEHNTPDSLFASVEEIVAYQSTAYNLEAVVEELEETKKDISNITTLGDCFKVGYRKGINEAIEIVKGGGLND